MRLLVDPDEVRHVADEVVVPLERVFFVFFNISEHADGDRRGTRSGGAPEDAPRPKIDPKVDPKNRSENRSENRSAALAVLRRDDPLLLRHALLEALQPIVDRVVLHYSY